MSYTRFFYALMLVGLVACGSNFTSGSSGTSDLLGEGHGGAAAVSVSASSGDSVTGSGGTASVSVVASSSSVASSAVASVSSSASTAATTSSSSTAASSSSSGGDGPTPEQLYAMYCFDDKVDNIDECDKNHANCRVVVAADCAFKCDRKYCVTVWVNHFCGASGDCLGVGLLPHPNSADEDGVYCCN